MPYSDIAQPYEYKGLSRSQATGLNKYELSKQGSAVTSNSLLDINHNKRPEEQTTDEWLNNWDRA
jgi:hypothetical protein